MVNVDKAMVAYLKTDGKRFEVMIDPEEAQKLKEGKKVSMNDVLAKDEVYSDAKRGFLASDADMQTVFGTTDPGEIAAEIIRKGEVPVTAAHKKMIHDQKLNQIMDFIRINGIDPRTNLPHPQTRIVNAFEEAKIKIDEHKTADQQIDSIITKLRPILPIKLAVQELSVKIPAQYAAKAYPVLKQSAKILTEDWQNDGSLLAIVELPAGLSEEYIAKLNSFAHGAVDAKVLRTK